jgi:hypothetical protein
VQVVDFSVPTTLEELAVHLGVTSQLLRSVTTDDHPSRFYIEHRIPKRRPSSSDTHRVVWEASTADLADAHKSFLRKFEAYAAGRVSYPHPSAHGYVRERSTLTNASPHSGKKNLLRADIRSFFPSISRGRVEQLFLELGLQPAAAEILARFATIDDRLPLGLHASPLLANLISLPLDERLYALAGEHGATYTRYADDLAFSSDRPLPPLIAVASALEAEGFELSEKKTRSTKRGQAHYVTGLSISGDVPRIPRKLKRRIRQELYYAETRGLQEHLGRAKSSTFQSGVNRIDGTIRYINAVEPTLGAKFREQWKRILDRDRIIPAYGPRRERGPWSITLFIDESEVQTADGRLLLLGCASIEDVSAVTEATLRVAREFLADPYAAGNKAALAKKGLHFVDAHEEMRTAYIRELGFLPFRGYLAYDLLPDDSFYESKYFELLSALLPHRLIAADRATMTIVAEQNSKISSSGLTKLVDDAYAGLAARGTRRPIRRPTVKIGKKAEDPCLAVVDFLLGVFGQYAVLDAPPAASMGAATLRKPPGETAIKRFERLRDKLRLVLSKVTAESFSRKNPFVPWADGRPTLKKP